jgi:hypothetical protein
MVSLVKVSLMKDIPSEDLARGAIPSEYSDLIDRDIFSH